MNTKHTPTPWRVVENIICAQKDNPYDGGYTDNVAACTHRTDSSREANADFIVRACNAHADLVAAASALVTAWRAKTPLAWQPENNPDLIYRLGAALDKANGE